MSADNFSFLQAGWPAVHEAASKAAAAVHPDPRTACFYARRTLELAVAWVYKSDASLKLPYQDNLSALIHDPASIFTESQLDELLVVLDQVRAAALAA